MHRVFAPSARSRTKDRFLTGEASDAAEGLLLNMMLPIVEKAERRGVFKM
jgi:hypothetical protein